jgi:hypothetical protein
MKFKITAIAVFAAVTLLATGAWAQSSEGSAGDAPFGVNAQSDAKGTKISGPLYVELLNMQGLEATDGAQAAVRLRKGGAIATLYAEIPGPIPLATPGDVSDLTDALLAALAPELFPSPLYPEGCAGCTVALKAVEEFEFLNTTIYDGTFSRVVITDITFVVQ